MKKAGYTFTLTTVEVGSSEMCPVAVCNPITMPSIWGTDLKVYNAPEWGLHSISTCRMRRVLQFSLAAKVLCGLFSSLLTAIYIHQYMQSWWNVFFVTSSLYITIKISFQISFTEFLIVGKPSSAECETDLQKMLHICKQSGFPIAERKIKGPTTAITSLGIISITVKMELYPFPPQQVTGTDVIDAAMGNHQEEKVKEKNVICNWQAAKVSSASGIFLRRWIDFSTSVKKLPHHTIISNSQHRADI